MGVGWVYPSAAQALSSGRDRCRSLKLPALKLVPSGVEAKKALAAPRRSCKRQGLSSQDMMPLTITDDDTRLVASFVEHSRVFIPAASLNVRNS